ncbi:SulP family inorganic anion transporter [Plantactinospora mayteni]|uniref:Carbonic anhydrase n=1 Tax=Plantactinospora mayteni TaxID=566021 RepID=A0ABQ4EQT8_9ACTN|nr:SulP family inorganic anion transporter [Plantactinospora mayteni]GIG96993.1 carbonic anhydrase [Plantactinospora mayteni]
MSPTSIGLAGTPTRLRSWIHGSLRYDLPASLVVFLVAVPLSLGIAAASNAPVAAGLIAAVVGGVVAGLLGGSPLQVTGPAAGLTVVVAELVSRYGWAATCAITVAAGLLQVGFGLCRIARTALALSPAIVHGMLAGIGVTIVLGQLHVLLGGEPGSTPMRNLLDLPAQLATRHDHAALIGLTVIGLLVLWPRLPRPVRRIPGPLVAVTLATLAAVVWNDVDLARVEMPGSLLAAVHLPVLPDRDWLAVAAAVLTVAVIASVESLLSATAVDRLAADRASPDVPGQGGPPGQPGPHGYGPSRPSNLDREMIGQGVANSVSGLLGGLPVTGVIVRSSTNVNAGARTRGSAVLHGVWVLLFAVLLVVLVERIPMAALAGLLVVVGLQLVKISDIRRVRRHRELTVYVVTALGVVVFNLLEGVLIGLVLAVVLILRRVVWAKVHAERVRAGPTGREHWSVHVEGTLSFLAVPRLSVVLGRVPPGSTVDLELVTDFLDHAAFDHLDGWVRQHETTGGRVHLDEVGPAALRGDHPRPPRRIHALVPPRWFSPWSSWQARHPGHPDGAGDPNRADQSEAVHAALRPLHVGVREYHRRSAARLRPFLTGLDGRHEPYSFFLTCADARIVPNVITSSGPGDLFTVRNIGNLIPTDHVAESSVAAALSYAVEVLCVPALLVCGHSGCGAMQGLLGGRGEEESHVGRWLRWGRPSLDTWRAGHPVGLAAAGDGRTEVDQLAMVNVARQVGVLREFLAARDVDAAKVSVQGMFFDIQTGLLLVLDERRQRFTSPPDQELEITGAGFVRP